ncbi:MFS transporter [Clostridium sp. AF19-22AC]|jgi:fucose permease|uniref:MFS transporter n=1 Tax=Clostridia TaxID=186801 RepID=UPI000E4977AD|nr:MULTISPECIES: MFS transporter [Clostridia]RHR27621.1 MFS transporter [Clostridium sp. AF19-22AC]
MKKLKLFLISLVLLFLLGIESGGFQISLLKMAEDFGLSGTGNGSLVAAQYSAIIMMPFLFGMVAERAGKIRILRIFCLVFAVGCGIVVSAHAYEILLPGIFLIGSGYSVCESLVSAVLTEQYREKAGLYLNLVQGAFSLGAVAGPHLISWAAKQGAGWNILFIICGIGFLVLWGCLLLKRSSGNHCISQGICSKLPDIKTAAPAVKKNVNAGSTIKFPPIFSLLVFSFFLYGGLEVGVSYYIDSYMQIELGGAPLSAWAVSSFWLFMVPSRFASGLLYRYRRFLLPSCFLLSVPVLFWISMTERAESAVILFSILGFLLGTLWPNLMGTATEDYKERAAMAAGIMSAGCGMGAVLSPLILGKLAGAGELRYGFILLAVCSLAGGILCICYLKKR